MAISFPYVIGDTSFTVDIPHAEYWIAVKPILDAMGLNSGNPSTISRLREHHARVMELFYPSKDLEKMKGVKGQLRKALTMHICYLQNFLESFNPQRCKYPDTVRHFQQQLVGTLKHKLPWSGFSIKPEQPVEDSIPPELTPVDEVVDLDLDPTSARSRILERLIKIHKYPEASARWFVRQLRVDVGVWKLMINTEEGGSEPKLINYVANFNSEAALEGFEITLSNSQPSEIYLMDRFEKKFPHKVRPRSIQEPFTRAYQYTHNGKVYTRINKEAYVIKRPWDEGFIAEHYLHFDNTVPLGTKNPDLDL